MNVDLLRLATHRRIGSRSWLNTNERVVFCAPCRSTYKWWQLKWDVEGGHRGIDCMRWRSLARIIALDLIHGTDAGGGRRAL